jgi:hypothetical protein
MTHGRVPAWVAAGTIAPAAPVLVTVRRAQNALLVSSWIQPEASALPEARMLQASIRTGSCSATESAGCAAPWPGLTDR